LKKTIIVLMIVLLLLSGCVTNNAPDIKGENIQPAQALQAASEPTGQDLKPQEEAPKDDAQVTVSLKEKMAIIGFEEISGYYTRKALEDETEYVEMFSFEKTTFIRIATSELEREVFAYNYASDDFTYMYYFDGDMTAKTIINIGTGAVTEDAEGYAELLTENADELKVYFSDLMEAAGLVPNELQ